MPPCLLPSILLSLLFLLQALKHAHVRLFETLFETLWGSLHLLSTAAASLFLFMLWTNGCLSFFGWLGDWLAEEPYVPPSFPLCSGWLTPTDAAFCALCMQSQPFRSQKRSAANTTLDFFLESLIGPDRSTLTQKTASIYCPGRGWPRDYCLLLGCVPASLGGWQFCWRDERRDICGRRLPTPFWCATSGVKPPCWKLDSDHRAILVPLRLPPPIVSVVCYGTCGIQTRNESERSIPLRRLD